MPIFKNRRPMKKKPVGAAKNNHGSKKKKKFPPKRAKKKRVVSPAPQSIESTGREALYLRDLIESGKIVVVVMNTGEEIRGKVRYYDRDVFSLGPVDGGPRIFLRKSSIRYLYEE